MIYNELLLGAIDAIIYTRSRSNISIYRFLQRIQLIIITYYQSEQYVTIIYACFPINYCCPCIIFQGLLMVSRSIRNILFRNGEAIFCRVDDVAVKFVTENYCRKKSPSD